MAVSKVIYGGETLIDLTSDTVTANDLAEGVTATAADGTQITGLLPKVDIDDALSSTSTNPVQNKVINAALAGYLPFVNSYIGNANSWLTNGYTKTSQVATINLPSVCTGRDKWGILFFIAENAANGTGTQMFFPIDGTYKGRIFTRNIAYKTAGTWNLLPLASDFATVATSGSYSDLTDTPTIPTVPTTVSSFTNDAGYLTEHQSLADYTKTEDLAAVATSGSYEDLTNKPTIPTVPTKVSSFTNDAGYLTSHQDISGKADKATTLAGYGITDAKIASGTITLGSNSITPLTSHQSLAAYAKTADLASVATSGSYEDLTNKPTIPSVYTLPTASSSTLGGIKVGTGLSINTSGVLSNSYSYTLPNATASVLGGVKIGSNITVSSGTISLTKSNVTSALGYTPPTSDTTYSVATTSSNGLMSSTDKSKLDGIATGANNYTHPSTHPASMITGLATVATSGSYNDLSDTPTIPDTSSFAQTGVANTWTAAQVFSAIDYAVTTENFVESVTPSTSVAYYLSSNTSFTLNLANFVDSLNDNQSMVFTCVIYNTNNSDMTLTVTGASAYRYIGSASDLSISASTMLLLNVLLVKPSGFSTLAILQGMALSNS